MHRPAFTILAALLGATAPPMLETPPVVSGLPPRFAVSGAEPGSTVRLHLVRRFSRWEPDAKGAWVAKPQMIHAWGDYRTDARGRVDLSTARPMRGTYSGAEPAGLLWSGLRQGDARLEKVGPATLYDLGKEGEARLTLTHDGGVVASAPLTFVEPPGLFVAGVQRPELNGVFAAPAGSKALPTVILLHGSEGGGAAEARALAVRYAGQGFAALALNYFAWDLKGLEGVPTAHVNLPIELIAVARDWLATRPEADVGRIGLYGHSKGAEFAEVAAVRFPWIRAVAACVPTDVVWEGYGADDERNRPEHRSPMPSVASSWSWQGKLLSYVPLRPFVTGPANPYFDNTERYELSRRDHPVEAKDAAIPLERTHARVLLLGGGRDEVWASGAMTTRLQARMRSAGRGRQVEAVVYPAAGHGICGDGTYPPRVWETDSSDPRRKDLTAEAAAAADAWRRIPTFFKRVLAR